jgi:hypothetical protein
MTFVQSSKFQLMRNLLLSAAIAAPCFAFAQKDVTLTIKYNDMLLCNWEVTIKHGDVPLAKATTDSHGVVKYNGVKLLSNDIDAFGFKPHPGGDKKWDAKGYIKLNDEGFAVLDFGPIVQEAGMPKAMVESAWGLTINDCGEAVSARTPQTTTQTKSETAPDNTESGTGLSKEEELALRKRGLDRDIAGLHAKISDNEKELKTLTGEDNEWDRKIKEAEMVEWNVQLQLKQHQLKMTEKEIAGGSPTSDDFITEKQLKDKAKKARDDRRAIEKEAKSAGQKENAGLTGVKLKLKIKKLEAAIKLRENGLKNERTKENPDPERIAELEEDIEDFKRELEFLKSKQ